MDDERGDLLPKKDAEMSVSFSPDALPAPLRDALAPNTGPPVVTAQRTSHTNAAKLESEKVVVAAPLSYAGSAARIWKLTGLTPNLYARVGLGLAATILIIGAWCFVTSWYVAWGILLVPYRFVRRGQRKRKREALQHRELIAAMKDQRD